MAETVKSTNGSDYRNWDLPAKSEYRFELEANTSLAIRRTSGTAEIYGAELAPGRLYLFGGECKAAVFTWYGCTLEMKYTSDETPMVPLINIHTAFEQMRIRAHRALTANQPETAQSRPPRVLVLGPENSGKTSACKIWCNYAVRGRSWCPTLVNLDVNDGGWTIPGTMSACPLSSAIPTCTPANPFGATATSAPTALSSSALLPVVHWFGHTDPKRNPQLVEKLIRTLANGVKQKFLQDHTLNASGLIIDAPAAFANPNAQGDNKYHLIRTCVEAFDVNTILIMGHDKLNVELQRIFGNSGGITLLKVPKSGGVVEVDYAYHTRVVASQIRAYFYGTPLYLPPSMNPATAQLGGEATTETTLSPFSVTLNAGDLQIYRIGSISLAPSSALPIGATRTIGEIQPLRVDVESGGILHSVLALLAPFDSSPSDEMLLRQEVSGFLIVTAVDIPRRKITVLAPSQGSLVGRVALIGSLEWQDR
ncbi:mRNA cleavage and polyadenylation factor CLP1 [Rhizoctonia solani AG-3 Rhs1AP]|uniref:Polynucleotide 5'-hydroxyl-kinase GRC3 n=1 Tax=Rhizoctonia solani AG-3 Rhs1AP TaxID=1086054 RepID=X8J727_9AGAM|nr:mRNA cleavage and polyadenylation factor CLP1 [Rhizoctonia solani AG-3 Rhs1AP]